MNKIFKYLIFLIFINQNLFNAKTESNKKSNKKNKNIKNKKNVKKNIRKKYISKSVKSANKKSFIKKKVPTKKQISRGTSLSKTSSNTSFGKHKEEGDSVERIRDFKKEAQDKKAELEAKKKEEEIEEIKDEFIKNIKKNELVLLNNQKENKEELKKVQEIFIKDLKQNNDILKKIEEKGLKLDDSLFNEENKKKISIIIHPDKALKNDKKLYTELL